MGGVQASYKEFKGNVSSLFQIICRGRYCKLRPHVKVSALGIQDNIGLIGIQLDVEIVGSFRISCVEVEIDVVFVLPHFLTSIDNFGPRRISDVPDYVIGGYILIRKLYPRVDPGLSPVVIKPEFKILASNMKLAPYRVFVFPIGVISVSLKPIKRGLEIVRPFFQIEGQIAFGTGNIALSPYPAILVMQFPINAVCGIRFYSS